MEEGREKEKRKKKQKKDKKREKKGRKEKGKVMIKLPFRASSSAWRVLACDDG